MLIKRKPRHKPMHLAVPAALLALLALRNQDELSRFLRCTRWTPTLPKAEAEAYLLARGWTRFTGYLDGWMSPGGVDWSMDEAVKLARMNAAVQWLLTHGWRVTGACGRGTFWHLILEMRRPGGGYLRGAQAWRSAVRAELKRQQTGAESAAETQPGDGQRRET